MPKQVRHGHQDRDESVLDRLAILARAGVWAEPGPCRPTAAVPVVGTLDGKRRQIGMIAREDWSAAIAGGWVEMDGEGKRGRLTRAARAELRRKRSSSGGNGNRAGNAAPKPGSVPALPEVNIAESPLSWLRQRRDRDGHAMISEAQFNAGERLRSDFWFAQMTPRVTTNWSATASAPLGRRNAAGACMELQDRVIAARERVHRALAAVGPELAGVLIDVCCHLKGLEDTERRANWPQRSGKVVLQIALTRLARHYGLDALGQSREPAAARILHWGSEGFRPTIDGGSN